MEISDFVSIAIVGTALSVFIEIIQSKFGTTSSTTKGITIALSVLVGTLFVLLKDTNVWQTIIGVLASASTVYAMFFSGKSS
jgi:hypothetical protein